MEQKSHKGQKIKTMVHNQIIDENRKVQPDFSKEVHSSGMYEDLMELKQNLKLTRLFRHLLIESQLTF